MKKLVVSLCALFALNAFAGTPQFNAAVEGCQYRNQGKIGNPLLTKDYNTNQITLTFYGVTDPVGYSMETYTQIYDCSAPSGNCTIVYDQSTFARTLRLMPDGSFVYLNSYGQGGAFVCNPKENG